MSNKWLENTQKWLDAPKIWERAVEIWSIENKQKETTLFTVRNYSKFTIWCKNEDDSGVFSITSGEKTKSRIDGLTHPARPGEVFKVVTIMMDYFGLDVYDNGISFQSAFWPIDKDLNELLGGGWLQSPPDSGWNPIFEKA